MRRSTGKRRFENRILVLVLIGGLFPLLGPVTTSIAAENPSETTASAPPAAGKRDAATRTLAAKPLGVLTVAPGNPMVKELVKFTARVTGAKRPVVLQRKVGKKWVKVAAGKSVAGGKVSLDGRLPGTATVRVVAPKAKVGKKTLKAYAGPTKRVTVAKQKGALALERNIFVGEKADVSATFSPARLNRTVRFERYQNKKWSLVATSKTNSAGKAVFDLVGGAVGDHTYRAVATAFKGATGTPTGARLTTILKSELTISPDVKLLSDAEAASLTEGTSPSGSTLKFGSGADQPDLAEGNILSLLPSKETPDGALVRLTDVTKNNDGSMTAQTEPASLPDVIENIPPDFNEFPVETLSTEVGDLPPGVELLGSGPATKAAPQATDREMGLKVLSSPQVRLKYTHEVSTGDNTYSAAGHIYVRPGIEVEYHAKVFDPDDWKLGIVADYDVGIELDASTKLVDQTFTKNGPGIKAILVAAIGPVPIVITSHLGTKAEVKLEAKVGIESALSVVSDRRFGIERFRGDTKFYSTGGENVVAQKPRPYAQGRATAFLGFTGNLYAYGLAGPYFKAGYEWAAEIKQALGDPLAYCVSRYPVAELGTETSDFMKRIFNFEKRFSRSWDFEKTNSAGNCDGSKPPTIKTSTLQRGLTGIGYYQKLVNENGSAPFTWSATGLPPGLTIKGDAVNGTPSQVGEYRPVITVSDKFGRTASRELKLSIVVPDEGSAALIGKIARLSDGKSWYIDKRGGKHNIPDGGTYNCLTAQGVAVVETVNDAVADLPLYEDAKCVRAEPGNIIRTSNTDSYLINSNWTRSWIPDGGTYECLRLNGHAVVDNVPRYYVDDLAQGADVTMSCYNADAVKGKVVRGSDGKSWYVDKRGGKHSIPDGGIYQCIAEQTGGVYQYVVPAAWLTQKTYEDAACVRANKGNIIRTADDDSYLINDNWTRSWIPDGGTYECLRANGRAVVNDVPRYYVDDLTQAADIKMSCYNADAVKGKVVRGSDGKSWYVDKRGGKHWIPDGGIFNCIAEQTGGAYANTVPAAWLTQTTYEDAKCVRAEPGNIIRHTDGDAHLINGNWTRGPIPTASSYACFRAEGRAVVDGVPRYYIEDLVKSGNAVYASGNCVIRKPGGKAYYLNNEGVREWIPDSPTWDCVTGRGVPVINTSDGLADSFSETGWHYCLNKSTLHGKILRHAEGGDSYRIFPDNTKTLIPDEFTYNCRTRAGMPVVNTNWREYINEFRGSEWEYCFDVETFKNKLIMHTEGDYHFITADGVRHYVHPNQVGCMKARFGNPHIVYWREYVKAMPEGEWAVCGDTLYRNQKLDRGQSLRSSNGYRLEMQHDGNLVVYHPNGNPIWAVGANGNARHVMLHDPGSLRGILARINYNREWSWQVGHDGSADRLVMQGDGNLVLYRGNTPVWASR